MLLFGVLKAFIFPLPWAKGRGQAVSKLLLEPRDFFSGHWEQSQISIVSKLTVSLFLHGLTCWKWVNSSDKGTRSAFLPLGSSVVFGSAVWKQPFSNNSGYKERKQLSDGNSCAGQSGCLVPLCYVYWPGASRGLHISERGYGPRLTNLISLVFWYAFAFYSSHPHRRRGPSLPQSSPPPFLLLLFNVKA